MALFKNTNIFIDIKNMVISYDAIVAMRLFEYFEENEGSDFFFVTEIGELENQRPQALAQNIMAKKNNYNFLLDYFDWSKLRDERLSGINPAKMCDQIYDQILQKDDFNKKVFNQIVSGSLMTSISQSFKLLMDDEKLETIYFYGADDTPEYVIKGLNFFYMNTNKKKYVKGSKKGFINSGTCNSYFVENPSDVDKYFKCPHNSPVEIYIPGSMSNTNVVEIVENTPLRVFTTDEPLEKYQEYNVNVYTLFLPI